MEIKIPDNLHLQIRKIRNIEVWRSDLIPLMMDGVKIQSVAVNAYGAVLQESVGLDGDFIIFSSWLPALVSGAAKEGAGEGTVKIHIEAACPTDTLDSLLARRRWIFPLCGGRVLHWVLGWVDFGTKHIGTFDSIPELGSQSWAIPLMLQTVRRIRQHIAAPEINFEDKLWRRQLHYPPQMQRQMDDWACGLFLMMAMKPCTEDRGFEDVADDVKEEMKKKVLSILLNIPIDRVREEVISNDEVEEVDIQYNGRVVEKVQLSREKSVIVKSNAQSKDVADPPSDLPIEPSNKVAMNVDSADGPTASLDAKSVKGITKDMKRKSSTKQSGYDTDEEKSKATRSVAASSKRAPKKPKHERKRQLEEDEWAMQVEAKQILCRGCNEWKRLGKDYEIKDWDTHKSKCSGITGTQNKRIFHGPEKFATAPAGMGPLTSFFKPRQHSQSSVADASGSSKTPAAAATDNHAHCRKTGTYTTKAIYFPTSIARIWSPIDPNTSSAITRPGTLSKGKVAETLAVEKPQKICEHLSGREYNDYIRLIRTRTLGGISFTLRARAARQLFPYKPFTPLQQEPDTESRNFELVESQSRVQTVKGKEIIAPANGNMHTKESQWTDDEKRKYDHFLIGWARWEVNGVQGFVKSTKCSGTTTNEDRICDPCREVASDESLKRSLRRKRHEAELPEEDQHEALKLRLKHTPHSTLGTDSRRLGECLKDPLIYQIHLLLEKGDHTTCFLSLFQAAREGKLDDSKTFTELCEVFNDRLRRESANNSNLKYGIRYPQNYLNFMILMRSRGGSTGRQYGILTSQLGGPSPRHLRALVAKSDDALTNPYLIFENMARVKRLVDIMEYKGPIIVAGDCTKVRQRLSYSTDFGSHILGSLLPLEECEVDEPEEIDAIIADIKKKKAIASQTRAIVGKIPLPEYPPIVIALIPADGKDTAEAIHMQHMLLLKMAERLDLKVLALAADGAATELKAQAMMDLEKSDYPPLVYQYPLYGIDMKAPVFKTGPCISQTDCPHSGKTARNQLQYGTHTASLGVGVLTNRSLVDLYETGVSGLVLKDVENVDKQDDGAARRVLHSVALEATTEVENGERKIRAGFVGLFVYLLIFGTLFDAWMSRTTLIHDRILSVLRARFWFHLWREYIINMTRHYPDLYSTQRSFISPAAFHIFNRLCDSLVLLALAYAKYYPDQPFCPWLMGTEFVEHFFGLARMILPNFTYAELLKMVQHIMVRQRILLSGNFKENREKKSKVGYDLDFDATPLTPEHQRLAKVKITAEELNGLVELAYKEAEMICKDLLKIPVVPISHEKPLGLVKVGIVPDSSDNEEEDEEDVGDDNDPESDSLGDNAEVAARDTARLSALCDDYDETVAEARDVPSMVPQATPISVALNADATDVSITCPIAFKSEIVDGNGKLSIDRMLKLRQKLQSMTKVNSERVVQLDSKSALKRVMATTNGDSGKPKMTIQEASQRVRVVQALAKDVEKEKKAREIRWETVAKNLRTKLAADVVGNISTRNINSIFFLKRGSYLVVRNESERTFIGEVLDLYKTASGNRYGSVISANSVAELKYLSVRVFLPLVTNSHVNDDVDGGDHDDDIEAPLFSCRHSGRPAELHTHVFSEHVLYHLGWKAFTSTGTHNLQLTPDAAKTWNSLTRPAVLKTLPKLKIRGGKMPGTQSIVKR